MIPDHPPLLATHDVFNQAPPLENVNLYAGNTALREAVAREGAAWADSWLMERGAELGSAEMFALGAAANRNVPTLKLFDATGHRRDEVEFHPAYHQLMAYLKRHGASGGPWADGRVGAHVARAAFYMMYAEVEDGTLCPTTMTYAVVPALRREPALAGWVDKVLATDYDERFLPGLYKRGVTMGMGMTEKQGGSDVRANTTRAEPVGASEWGDEYRITGHKWFFSAPMCDAFLVLAQAPGGLTCFFLPRFTPEGRPNEIRIQRLKDKLGDRSNAGSEVEFWGARAWRVGAEGRGVPTILEMGTYTRLDCALGTAGLMRAAVSLAIHHARHRSAFGKRLIDQPLMQNVLADMALESEAATALALRLARAFDRGLAGDEQENMLARVLTPAAKYWICKRGPILGGEAMEVWGGNGYVEDGPMARIYRQMPLNSIWEGSGNIMGLDVLRAFAKHPPCVEALAAELAPALGCHPAFDAFAARLKDRLADPRNAETRARELTQGIALAVQGALLLRHAPAPVADAFCASRLVPGHWGAAFGTLAPDTDFATLLQRALPEPK
jgi:putative acyl-CoA dehydrogenase